MRQVPLGLLLAPLLAGCYENLPLAESRPEPALGTHLVIELTDDGRVRMSRDLGRDVASVEGALVERSDSQYVLAVAHVVNLWGVESRWEGERVAFRTSSVRRMFVRRIAPGKTALAVTGATAGFLAFVLTRNLIGGGTPASSGPPGGTNGN